MDVKLPSVPRLLVAFAILAAACGKQGSTPNPPVAGGAPGSGGGVATEGTAAGGVVGSGGAAPTGGMPGGGGSAGGAGGDDQADALPATGGQGAQPAPDASAGPEVGDAAGPARDTAPDAGPGAGGVPMTGGSSGTRGSGGAGGAGGVAGDAPTEVRPPDAPVPDAPPRDASGAIDANDLVVTFKNGGFWNDTNGKRIEAHGGGFYLEGDTWYWIGEDKSATPANPRSWVNLYSSKDLVTWQFRKAVVTSKTSTEFAASDRVIERPKLIYNDSTKQYVIWLHFENSNYSTASAGVLKSATIDGDYTFVKAWKPLGNMSRDCNLFKDDDGKAYFISTANENADMMVYELTDDYLDVKQLTLKLWAGAKREAPALFKVAGTYFMVNSAATGWDPNQAQYASATNIAGPWTGLTNIGDSTTYDTQSTYVIPVVGNQTTTYLYAGDRWQDPDLPSSKYIWLPLVVKGTKLGMDYYNQWSLNLTTGTWSAGNTRYLAKDGWKLIKVDSEETSNEDGRGINAFDGLSSTIWHSRYTGGTVALPHEIQIDLGATYNLTEFAYLPRQDNNKNGVVGQYELYLSTDSANWGTAVKTGAFANDFTEKVVTFPSTTAHYLRFRALSEVQGKQYTAVAELNVVGTAAP